MNCLVGLSNGAVTNYIVDDPLVTSLHVSLQFAGKYIHFFKLKNLTTDYPTVTTFPKWYTKIYYPGSRVEEGVGYDSMELKKTDTVANLEMNFYSRDALDKFVGGATLTSDVAARRFLMRIFTDCDIRNLVKDQYKNEWTGELVTVGELYNNAKQMLQIIQNNTTSIERIMEDVRNIAPFIESFGIKLNALDTTLKQHVAFVKDLQSRVDTMNLVILKHENALNQIVAVDERILRDDRDLQEAVGKIQTFLKNIQIATSGEEKFIKYDPVNITLPKKDITHEIAEVQQKLEYIKDYVNKLNDKSVTKIVNHRPSNVFKF